MKEIRFYDNNGFFGALANTSNLEVNFKINGKVIVSPSSECIYQGLKGVLSRDNVQVTKGEHIMQGISGTGRAVQIAGQQFNGTDACNNFHQSFMNSTSPLKELIMKDIVKAKITQHPSLLKAIMEENGAYFIENSPTDLYWGIGSQNNGKNVLGKIITEVAKELRDEFQQTNSIRICDSFTLNTINVINSTNNMRQLNLEQDSGIFIDLNQYNATQAYNQPTQINLFEKQYKATQTSYQNPMPQMPNTKDMSELAKFLTDNVNEYTKFTGKSRAGSFITCEVHPKNSFTIQGLDRNGANIVVKYDSRSNTITENGKIIPKSNYGEWAKNIIENQVVHSNLLCTSVNKATGFKIPGITFGSMKDLASHLIKNEPDCEFTAVSRNKQNLKCKIVAGKEFIIEGVDKYNKSITVKYDSNNKVYENNISHINSGYGDWAKGIIEYGVNHPKDLIGLSIDISE